MVKNKKNYVNSDKKKCTVKWELDDNVLRKEINSKCSKPVKEFLREYITVIDGIGTIKASSECDDIDSFNEKIGLDIADLKCSSKYHKIMLNKYRHILDILNDSINEIERLESYHYKKLRNISNDYERVYAPTNIYRHGAIDTGMMSLAE